jgi:hypothetical protein
MRSKISLSLAKMDNKDTFLVRDRRRSRRFKSDKTFKIFISSLHDVKEMMVLYF